MCVVDTVSVVCKDRCFAGICEYPVKVPSLLSLCLPPPPLSLPIPPPIPLSLVYMLVGLSQNVDYLSWLEGRRTEYLGKGNSLQRPDGSQMLLTAIHSRVVLVLYPEFQGPLCLSLCFFYIFRDAVVWVWAECSPRLVHGLEDWLPVWWHCSGRACKRWSLLDTVVHTCNPSTPQHTIPAPHRQQPQHPVGYIRNIRNMRSV